MLRYEPDHRHQTNLCVNVHRRQAYGQRQKRAKDRRRQRNQDDKGITKTLILCSKHEVDDDKREDECDHQRTPFLHILAAFTLPVIAKAFGELFSRDLFQVVDPLTHRAAGKRNRRKRC